MAVAARASVRFTADLDLVVAVPSDAAAENLLRDLLRAGYQLEASLEDERTGRLSTARLRPPGETTDALLVDLLFTACGIEAEIVRDAEMLATGLGILAPIARLGHLIAMKLLARDDRRRPADYDDLERLRAAADARELERAREAVMAIAERGYDRGRDLTADLERLIAFGHP